MILSPIAGGRLAVALGCTLLLLAARPAAAQAQQNPYQARPGQGGVLLQLPEPYAGLDCGAAYQPGWNLSLDQVTKFAETQLSACDLALTLATIEGDVGRAYDKIVMANTQNWTAYSAAAAFLPGPDDPAAADRSARVRDAQARIQNARDGLRFLAKLAAVMQFPPPAEPEPQATTVPQQPPAGSGQIGQTQPSQAQPEGAPSQAGAIDQTQLPPIGATPPSSDGQAAANQNPSGQNPLGQNPFGQGPLAGNQTGDNQTGQNQGGLGQSGAPLPARPQVACVTNTSWVVAPRPAQNKGQMVIDDPVAGQALVWLAGFTSNGAAQSGFHAFAACPGAVPSFSPSSYPAQPGAAQGLATSATPPAPDQTAPQAPYPGPATGAAPFPPANQPPTAQPNTPPAGQQD